MLSVSDLQKDMLIQLDGVPFRVVAYQHTQLGRGGAIAKTKLKNLANGSVVSQTFKGNEKIEPAEVSRVDMQYLYKSGQQATLMDESSYEQYQVGQEAFGKALDFLNEGAKLIGLVFNSNVVGVEVPPKVELKVTYTEPATRGDTAKAAQKPAKLETGASINVPLFINQGDQVRVDTRSGNYIERI